LPAVVAQSMIFVGLMTADRAARDHLFGFGERIRTLPVPAAATVTARVTATLMRGSFCLVMALVAGYVLGFRLAGGLVYSEAFVFISLLL
ncbi:ABC transporter, partial [Mycobacterium timonense]